MEPDNLEPISPAKAKRMYLDARKHEVSKSTLDGYHYRLKHFIRWCESIDAVEQGLHEKVQAFMPTLTKSDEQSEAILDPDDARALLGYLRKFEYASRAHVIVELLWHTGIRPGALHSLDVDDYDEEHERLELHHRPGKGTPPEER